VGCKWFFRIKRHVDGSLAHYKARVVAKGFTQSHGVDFHETFTSVVRPQTIKNHPYYCFGTQMENAPT